MEIPLLQSLFRIQYRAWVLFWLLGAVASAANSAEAMASANPQPMTLIGAELPPYAYRQDGRIEGLGVELLREMARRLGQPDAIALMPFKRAFYNAQVRPNLLMTPVARVRKREGLLKWAIHYIDDSFFYVSRAGSEKLSHRLARRKGIIGVLAGSAPLAQLQAAGVDHYLEQTHDTANINMLRMGRIDGWFTSAMLLSAAFKSSPDLSPADFVIGEVQSRHCVYIVASNDTSEAALHPWRQAFEEVKADGSFQRILDRYLDPALQRLLREGSTTEPCEVR